MINCLIIDDERIARRGIERYVLQIPYLNLIGSARSATEAVPFLGHTDLMILDIQLPRGTGIEFLKTLEHPPVTILLTAYPEYALEGYELDVMDYMVKPVAFERFLKGCDKVREYIDLKQRKPEPSRCDSLFLKTNGKIEKVLFEDILYLEAMENYSQVHTTQGSYLTLVGLGNMEGLLDKSRFLRVHKSFIISLDKIRSLERGQLIIGKRKIPVSRRMRKELRSRWLI